MPIIQTQISAGKQPTGTKNITSNGIVDVSDYANADVQVPTTAPAKYIEYTVNSGYLTTSTTAPVMNFSGATRIASYKLFHAYEFNENVVNLDMSSFTTIDQTSACESAFYKCPNLKTVDISSVTSITGERSCANMFNTCKKLETLNAGSLRLISGVNGWQYICAGCILLSDVNVSSLTTTGGATGIMEGAFIGCTSLTRFVFQSLKLMYFDYALKRAFSGCTNLTDIYFYAINNSSFNSKTNQFVDMCQNIPNVTLHFPSNVQNTISGLYGYSTTAPFGAISGTILYDLPATNILTGANSVNYERNPKYDTATALCWRVENTNIGITEYYTSGTTDPVVGDTIYSNSACTTAVTTIDSIA